MNIALIDPRLWGRVAYRCALASSVVFLTCCLPLRVASDFDRSVSFSGYHSFTLMDREHQGSNNPLVVQRARAALESELTRKGFTRASSPEQADFAVDFTIGSRERTEIQSYPAPYVSYGWWGYPGWWGPYWGSQVDVRQYREGTLSIDIFDGHSHQPVWHGWAKKELTHADLEHPEAPIRAAVAAVLQRFPP